MENKKLSTEDRKFFSLVSRASFINPFSPERVEIDRQIASGRGGKNWIEMQPEVVGEIRKRIKLLDDVWPVGIDEFCEADQEIVEHALLFDIYHKFNLKFDKLIEDQIDKGDQPLAMPFAGELLGELEKRGFGGERAKHYISLFFQMRRAFYFIQHKLIGQCDSMKQLRMNLWNNVFTCDILHYEKNLTAKMEDFSTLLLGPTGCGKGTAAAAIGRSGYIPFDDKKMRFTESFTRTFVPVNLSQYAETLLESELFGHSKGAFTGAISPHDGLLAMCGPCGSVFLDEIGEVGEQVQIKLLKVLEEREFSPVGSHEKLSFRGRVIGATNQGIGKLIEQGKFRDDFYYRLCSDCIEVPSLKQRISESPDELAELTREVTRRITGQESEGIVESTLEVIGRQLGMEYDWPGNVRELAQCIRRVIIKRDYQPDICNGRLDAKAEIAEQIYDGEVTAQRLLATYCNLLYEKHGNYEKVAQITGLDRRTAKKHIQSYEQD